MAAGHNGRASHRAAARRAVGPLATMAAAGCTSKMSDRFGAGKPSGAVDEEIHGSLMVALPPRGLRTGHRPVKA